jgi:hypothetical protein
VFIDHPDGENLHDPGCNPKDIYEEHERFPYYFKEEQYLTQQLLDIR